jgi:lipopolysaccharide export system permease protein
MRTTDRYILKSHLGPFAFGFFVTTGVLLTEVLKNFLDDFLAKGISPLTIAELLLLSLGHTLALSVPMAVLVATLMAFGQMAQDHELTALKASGISLYRVMLPVLLAGAVLCAAMILFNNYVLPESNHRLAGLITDIGRQKPTVNIEPGIYVDDFEGYKLYFGDKKEDSDEIRDVRVHRERPGTAPDILVAPKGRLYNRGSSLHIELYDGEWHQTPQEGSLDYRVTRFDSQEVIIRDVAEQLQRTDRKYRSDREMNLAMIRRTIAEKERNIVRLRERVDEQGHKLIEAKLALLDPKRRDEALAARRTVKPGRLTTGSEARLRDTVRMEQTSIAGYERQIRSHEVEAHKKFAIPAACIVFVLFGAPLAILAGRSGWAIVIAFSLSCFLVYYLFITGGEKLADRGFLSPFLAMWGANIVFGILGLWLTWRSVIEASVMNFRRLDPRTWWPRRLAAR